jgi:hypothetical protein
MCDRCHYLTDILLDIIEENEQLRNTLAFAEADGDAERITTIGKAIEENATQVRIIQERIDSHVADDHRAFLTAPN